MHRTVIRTLGIFGARHFGKHAGSLKKLFLQSNLSILFEIYIGKLILAAIVAFFVSMPASFYAFYFILDMPFIFSVVAMTVAAFIVTAFMVLIFYTYPFHIINSRKGSIEANMPFAINHMAAISGSGVPPFVIFKLLSRTLEYGEVAQESERIVRNVDLLGMDLTAALKNVADRTPSKEFKQFLYGFVSNMETGGDLRKYLDNSGKDAMFDYKLKREKYLKSVSTYADIYTAVLIAAPLFFISILSVMSLLGGTIAGLSILDTMKLGVYFLIPSLNVVFLLFLQYTQPKV